MTRMTVEIVKAIVAMARAMNPGVIAEGIETQEQLERFRELGCTDGQGDLLSVPLMPVQIEASLAPVRTSG